MSGDELAAVIAALQAVSGEPEAAIPPVQSAWHRTAREEAVGDAE